MLARRIDHQAREIDDAEFGIGALAHRAQHLIENGDAILVGKERILLGGADAHRDHQRIDQLAGPLDDIEVAIGQRIE
ncbi:hypothetical protein D3C72_1776360 [compost metagenome]